MEKYPRVWNPVTKRHERVHRKVAEQKLGRPLRPCEVVHHWDEDKWNASPENMHVCESQRQHMAIEHFQRRVKRGQTPLFEAQEIWGRREALDVDTSREHGE